MKTVKQIADYQNLVAELTIRNIPFYGTNNAATVTFTPFGYIELISPVKEDLETVYAILNIYRRSFYFREAITSTGAINIWIYTTKKQYRDHVYHILNNCHKSTITKCAE